MLQFTTSCSQTMYIFCFCLSAQGGDQQVYKLLNEVFTVCTMLGAENRKHKIYIVWQNPTVNRNNNI